MKLNATALTHLGKVRKRNEDACGFHEAAGIAFVADGVGGHAAGDVASSIVAETIADVTHALDTTVITRAQQKMRAYVAQHPEHSGLGTTLVAIQLKAAGLLAVLHIGDSRAYRLAAHALVPITDDHSYVGELVRAGMLTREAGRVHPLSNLITRYIGSDTDFAADFNTLQVESGDRFLLATDGLTDMVPETEIEQLVTSLSDRAQLAQRLIQAALDAGGTDNISVVVADIT